jgi:HEAT repeat protein
VSREAEKTDASVLDALLNTLNGDPSTNVRLAAVDALYIFRDQPRVREALVQLLERQKSPLVQISIIDLLVEIREQKAMDALRFLIQNERTNPSVREHAEWGIRQLI